jgi:hypothetical protein
MIFDLTRRTTTARPAAPVAPRFTAPAASFYRFPAAWRRIKHGMTQHEALEVLGEPRRTEVRRDLRKPAARWFYGPADSHAIELVDGRVFAVASRIF